MTTFSTASFGAMGDAAQALAGIARRLGVKQDIGGEQNACPGALQMLKELNAAGRRKPPEGGATMDLEMTAWTYRFRIPRTELSACERERLYGHTRFEVRPTGKRLAYFLWALFRRF